MCADAECRMQPEVGCEITPMSAIKTPPAAAAASASASLYVVMDTVALLRGVPALSRLVSDFSFAQNVSFQIEHACSQREEVERRGERR